jgi:hypothetical protein
LLPPDAPVFLELTPAEADALRLLLMHPQLQVALPLARLLLAVLDKLPAPEGG